MLGTVGYMAPEQVRGEPADARSDIFAFGAVLYEMLSGQRAFRGDSAVETMSAILKEDPPELSTTGRVLPPGVDRIVRHCLEKNPAERFQSARDLAFDLDSLSGVSSTARVEPLAGRRGSGRALRAAAGALLVAVVASALGWWAHGRLVPDALDLSRVTVRQLTFGHRWIMSARFVGQPDGVVFSQQEAGGASRIGVLRPGAPEPDFLPYDDVHLLAVSPAGELALLTHAEYIGHRVFTGTLARMPLAGAAPKEILEDVREADWAPDGSGLAIVRLVDGTDRLEYPVGKVLHTTSGYLSDLRFSRDGGTIAFFEHPGRWDDRGYVDLLHLASGEVHRLTEEFFLLEGLAWSADGEEILFSALDQGEGVGAKTYAARPDGTRRAVLVGFGLDQLLDVAPDGRLLVLREETVKSILVHRHGEDRVLRTGASYYQLAMTRDGSRICYTDERVEAGRWYSVIVRDTDGSAAIRVGPGWCADLSPDGSWALGVVSKDPPELWAYPIGPGQPRRLDGGRFTVVDSATFGAADRVLVCGRLRDGGAGCLAQTLDGDPAAAEPIPGAVLARLSPDGGRLVDNVNRGDADVAVLVPGSDPVPVAGLKPTDAYVDGWSPDGTALRVVGGFPPNGFYVDRLQLADGSRVRLIERSWPDAQRTRYDGSLACAADPTTYAFGLRDSQSQLYEASGVR